MTKLTSHKKKTTSAGKRVPRESATGELVGFIGDSDARDFSRANTALIRQMARSKASAIKILKASGFLTSSGRLAKRYK